MIWIAAVSYFSHYLRVLNHGCLWITLLNLNEHGFMYEPSCLHKLLFSFPPSPLSLLFSKHSSPYCCKWRVPCTTQRANRKKMGREKKKEASGRRIRCFHPLINGFLKQSTSEEPADQWINCPNSSFSTTKANYLDGCRKRKKHNINKSSFSKAMYSCLPVRTKQSCCLHNRVGSKPEITSLQITFICSKCRNTIFTAVH